MQQIGIEILRIGNISQYVILLLTFNFVFFNSVCQFGERQNCTLKQTREHKDEWVEKYCFVFNPEIPKSSIAAIARNVNENDFNAKLNFNTHIY